MTFHMPPKMSAQDLLTPSESSLISCKENWQSGDYDLVVKAINFLGEHWRDQPDAEAVSRAVGVDSDRLSRVFRRWAGLTPKAFIQAMTYDAARSLLSDQASVLDTCYEVGLSGPSRLHDLFVTHEAMPPGIYRAKGAGVTIKYGFHPSPFGQALVMATDYGLAGLAFADIGEEAAALEDMTSRWPQADYVHDAAFTAEFPGQIFNPNEWDPSRPLRLVFIGTDFEVKVWEQLVDIPFAGRTTYSDIAAKIGKPKAFRAVGSAVGRNPLSFVVPCHRVLGKSGGLRGYHWGVTRKRVILGWERAMTMDSDAEAQKAVWP